MKFLLKHREEVRLRVCDAGAPNGRDDRGELGLARRLGDLHQLLYTRGGIRPVDAAVEELSKLLLLEIAAERLPELSVHPHGTLREILDAEPVSIDAAKAAFSVVVGHPDLAGRLPSGEKQPVWPLDEPLRITRRDILTEALRVLRRTDISQASTALDPLGTAFDVFLSGKYEHAGGLGTHLTPTTVAINMARIGFALLEGVDWGAGAKIADPCCGTGRFLVAALEHLRTLVSKTIDSLAFERFAAGGLLGADQSSSSVAKARVNLLSYGIHAPEVFTVDDSITDRALDAVRGKLKLILTNPPFGEGKYDSKEGLVRTYSFFPSLAGRTRIDPALAFVARCLDLLEDGGVAGIILPDGIVEGSTFRSCLEGVNGLFGPTVSLEALVSLPSITFALGGTTAKTSAVFLRRGRSAHSRIYLGRADHVGYLKQGGAAVSDPDGDDLPTIASNMVEGIALNGSGRTGVLSRKPLVTAVLRDDVVTLDLGGLDPEAIEARDAIRTAGGVELGELIRPLRRRHRERIPEGVPFVSVLHVDDLGNVGWREARTHRPSTPGVSARAGQIIVSLLNPRKFRAAVIPERYRIVQCSAEFGVFEATSYPYAVLALMQHPLVRAQIAPLGRGTSSSRRRIESEDVLRLLVPRRSREWFAETDAAVRKALETTAAAEAQLLNCYEVEAPPSASSSSAST